MPCVPRCIEINKFDALMDGWILLEAKVQGPSWMVIRVGPHTLAFSKPGDNKSVLPPRVGDGEWWGTHNDTRR
jgi:hypothetical protein